MRKHYTAKHKAQITLEMLKEERPIAQIASENGIHPNQLYKWKTQALDGLPGIFEDDHKTEKALKATHEKEMQELYAEIGRLNTQLNWLKKNLASTLLRSERYQLIERNEPELPLVVQTELLSLNRTSLYYEPAGPSAEEVAAKHHIDKLYTEHPYYGSRRITVVMCQEGRCISRPTVQRYMREMGIAGIAPGPNLSKRSAEHKKYPYLLRGLAISCPNQVWGIEIV